MGSCVFTNVWFHRFAFAGHQNAYPFVYHRKAVQSNHRFSKVSHRCLDESQQRLKFNH